MKKGCASCNFDHGYDCPKEEFVLDRCRAWKRKDSRKEDFSPLTLVPAAKEYEPTKKDIKIFDEWWNSLSPKLKNVIWDDYTTALSAGRHKGDKS
jgi:hypothetical protein